MAESLRCHHWSCDLQSQTIEPPCIAIPVEEAAPTHEKVLDKVVFGDFRKSAKLPEGKSAPVEFVPDRPGEYEFVCQMAMIRGKLIIE